MVENLLFFTNIALWYLLGLSQVRNEILLKSLEGIKTEVMRQELAGSPEANGVGRSI